MSRSPQCSHITKTYLYNFDPLKPHFYIVKLGFLGVYIIFLISAQTIDCGYSLEPPRRGGSNEYPQSMFCAKIYEKISEFFFYLKIFSFWRLEIHGSQVRIPAQPHNFRENWSKNHFYYYSLSLPVIHAHAHALSHVHAQSHGITDFITFSCM